MKTVKVLERRVIEIDLPEYERLTREYFNLTDFSGPKYQLLDMIEFKSDDYWDDEETYNCGLITAASWNKVTKGFFYTVQYRPPHDTSFKSIDLSEEQIKGRA